MSTHSTNSQIALALRWAARVAGLLLTAFVVFMVVGHGGLPNVAAQPVSVQLEFAAMALMLVGFVAGWWRELVGGGLALIGFALFYGVELAVNASLPGGVIFHLFCLPGLLFVASSIVTRRQSRLPQSNH